MLGSGELNRRRFDNQEEMKPQGGSPACPHPHHNRHPGKQDEDGARSPSLLQPQLQHQRARQPRVKPCAHRDQDVGTRGGQALTWTTLRPPCLASTATSQRRLVVWAPAKRPRPSSRDHNFPVASGYPELMHTPPSCYTTAVRARTAPTPRWPDSPRRNHSPARRAPDPLRPPGI